MKALKVVLWVLFFSIPVAVVAYIIPSAVLETQVEAVKIEDRFVINTIPFYSGRSIAVESESNGKLGIMVIWSGADRSAVGWHISLTEEETEWLKTTLADLDLDSEKPTTDE